MTPARLRLGLLLLGLLLVVGLPVAARLLRDRSGPRCGLDGLPIEPLYQVRVVDRAGRSHRFCCVRCAANWLARSGEPAAAVYVTDEASGAEVEVRAAWFVRSPVGTNAVTGNRVHAFRDRSAAEAHVRTFGGEVLTGADRPFVAELAP
jgi:hypothetical protein